MKNLIHVLLVLAAMAILAYPAAKGVDALFGADVHLLAAVNDDATVELNRAIYLPDESAPEADRVRAVVEIYGSSPTLEIERVLLLDDSRVIRPEEMPELALLPAGSAGGEYPVQVQSLLFTAQRVTFGGFVAGILLLLIRRMLLGKGG